MNMKKFDWDDWDDIEYENEPITIPIDYNEKNWDEKMDFWEQVDCIDIQSSVKQYEKNWRTSFYYYLHNIGTYDKDVFYKKEKLNKLY